MLAELIDLKYDTRTKFADDLGVSKSVVSDICTGRTRLRGTRREKAARLLGVDAVSLLPLQNDKKSPVKPDSITNLKGEVPVAPAGWKHVPIYGALAAGAMSYTYSDVLEWEVMPEWGGDFERWGRIVSGDSMRRPKKPKLNDEDGDDFEDDGFREGDIVIFESRRHESGHAVHAFDNGEDAFKIYTRSRDGEERLIPLNPEYEPLEAKKYTVKGIAIKRIRKGPKGVRDIREWPNGYRI